MKIYIPKKFKETEWTEGQAIFLSFMSILAEIHGWQTEFNMHNHDFKTIIGSFIEPSTKIGLAWELREAFHMTRINENNWNFKWKDYDEIEWRQGPRAKSGGKNLSTSLYILKRPKSIAIWSFLMGRLMDPSIISDTTKILPHKNETNALPEIINKNFNL